MGLARNLVCLMQVSAHFRWNGMTLSSINVEVRGVTSLHKDRALGTCKQDYRSSWYHLS